jgi:hypothetical protein
MPNILRRLKIREVSSVDRGAGEDVRVMLFKRALSEQNPTGGGKRRKPKAPPQTLFQHQESARAAFGNKPSEGAKDRRGRQRHLKALALGEQILEDYRKRVFSGKDRKRLAATGAAMPGGGYPIANEGDLRNAIRAVGRAKDPAKTRAHIMSRARSLGHADLIPEGWVKKADKKSKKPSFEGAAPPFGADDEKKPTKKTARLLLKIARDLGTAQVLAKNGASFDDMMAEMSQMDTAEGLVEAIRDATHAVKDSIESIADCDDMMPNEKATAIAESLEQFKDHIAGIAPGPITKALRRGLGSMTKLQKKLAKAFHSVPAHDATPPTKDKDTKIDNDADENVAAGTGINPPKTATSKQLRKAAKKLEKRAAKAEKLLAASLSLSKAEKDYMDEPDADMDDEKKKAFIEMAPEDRAKFMKKNPLEKIAEKRVATLPEPIRKQLAQSAKDSVELAKRIEAEDMREFAKNAAEIGQSESFGAHLRVLAKGLGTEEERVKAFGEVMTVLKAATEQARAAGLFSTFGTARGATGTAWDQLMAKAEEYRGEVSKNAGARPLTPEQAFAKVYEDPANAALVKQYNEEKRRAA